MQRKGFLFWGSMLGFMSGEAMAEQGNRSGFSENGKLTFAVKNFYFQRDFRNGGSNMLGSNPWKPAPDRNGYAQEWAQGLIANYRSGFTPGTVGFGLDAQAMLGLKLDGGGGRTGLRLLPIASDGKPEDDYSRVGGALKLRLSNSVLKYGQMMPTAPVLSVNTVRLFPSEATGLQLNIDEIEDLRLEAGHYTRQTGVDSSNSDDRFTTDYALRKNGKLITYDSASFVGGKYRNAPLSVSFYAGELEDAWHQYYGNAKYGFDTGSAGKLGFDFNVYRTRDYGKSLAGPIDNTSWSLASAYTSGPHTITLIHQRIDGDEPLDWVGFDTMGSTVTIGNAVQYATFSEANERSWQLRYDLDMAAFGVPGLSLMVRYVRGDHMDNARSRNALYTSRFIYDRSKDNKHWERDLDIKYVIQSGPARGLALRLRQATHRATTGYRYSDIEEVRIITEFPFDIL